MLPRLANLRDLAWAGIDKAIGPLCCLAENLHVNIAVWMAGRLDGWTAGRLDGWLPPAQSPTPWSMGSALMEVAARRQASKLVHSSRRAAVVQHSAAGVAHCYINSDARAYALGDHAEVLKLLQQTLDLGVVGGGIR